MLQKGKTIHPFYSQIGKLVLPIVIQNLLSAMVNSADVVMLNYVSQSAISAVSLAAQYASILFMVFYGLGTGATMLCAQYYGKGDMRAIEVVEGIALRFSLVISTAFALMAGLVPELMMRVFTNDAELIELGATYLRILSPCYFFWGIIEIYLSVLRSIGRVVVCTVLNTLAFVLNIVLNAVFIFGLFGAPKLGVAGVAIATTVSRAVELLGCFLVSARSKDIKLKFSFMLVKNKILFQDFVRLSLPALANDVVWGVGFSMYSVIIGHMGNDAVAANSLVTVVRNFGTILCFGIASAGGILLGKEIGENRLKEAEANAKRLMKLTVVSGAVGGVLILLATPFVLMYADLSETAMGYLKVMLLINSYYVMGAAVNTTLIAGVFRAGGDSRFGLICDAVDMWAYAVPLGFLTAFVLKLPVLWVYFLMCTDEFVKWPWVIKHYRSKKWLNNITKDGLFDEKE
ncbi:MAG: MATE family efflux transporter [Lachnospiraceae bacterium]|nr:MATE family efflux transporter [Lachnospiraceae bacterium]